MRKTVLLLLTLLVPSMASAEIFDWRRLYGGAGLGAAAIDQMTETPDAIQLFLGYSLIVPRLQDLDERLRLDIEAGMIDVSDYDYDSYWVAPALSYRLGADLDMTLRLGYETGDSSGLLGALGVTYYPEPQLGVRLELVEREETSLTMINLVYRP